MTKTKAMLSTIFLIALTCCAGPAARQNLLWPAVKEAWPGVKLNVLSAPSSVDAMPQVRAVDRAVDLDDTTQLAGLDFSIFGRVGSEGIDARVTSRQISQGVAGSLRERLRRFVESLSLLSSP